MQAGKQDNRRGGNRLSLIGGLLWTAARHHCLRIIAFLYV
jgi:hypothetical protein